ncbi:putative G-protein coupled receptor 139 [Tubulanus polymorphus]|uniref:putative G-protein coupled receptor 139 n=1 Tax=Tubulanus polymorphus TaxID=672921 RepID=UPI003DA27B8B
MNYSLTTTTTISETCNRPYAYKNVLLVSVKLAGALPISIVGITLNGFSISIIRRQSSDHISLYLLRCLALADILFLIFNTIQEPLRFVVSWFTQGTHMFWFPYLSWGVRPWIYKTAWIPRYSAQLTRNWITVLLVLERCVSLAYPFFARTHVTKSRIRTVICCMVIVFAIMYCPFVIGTEIVVRYFDPCNDVYISTIGRANGEIRSAFYEAFHWLDRFVGILAKELIPVILLSTCNCYLIWTLRKLTAKRNEMIGGETTRLDVKATKIAIAIVILFVICEVPPSFRSMYHFFGMFLPNLPVLTYTGAVYIAQMMFNDLLPTLNSSVNFFIYYLANDNFRATAKKLLLKYANRPGRLASRKKL